MAEPTPAAAPAFFHHSHAVGTDGGGKRAGCVLVQIGTGMGWFPL